VTKSLAKMHTVQSKTDDSHTVCLGFFPKISQGILRILYKYTILPETTIKMRTGEMSIRILVHTCLCCPVVWRTPMKTQNWKKETLISQCKCVNVKHV